MFVDAQIDHVLQTNVVCHEIAREEVLGSESLLAREPMELAHGCRNVEG
jgi:hypothetical protein